MCSLLSEGLGGVYTLMTPFTPFRIGCKPCVYRGFDTLAPLNKKNPMRQT